MHRGAQAFHFWSRPAKTGGLVLVFGVIAVMAGVAAAADLRIGVPSWNVAIDLAITAGAIGAGAVYGWRSVHFGGEAQALLHHLDEATADADYWRAEAAGVLPALGAAIHRQFERWTLTRDEQYVALMLMNGHSSKQIADLCGRSVLAVRQTTIDIYRKAGVNGRVALAAFFLQDLLFLAGHPTTRQQRPP